MTHLLKSILPAFFLLLALSCGKERVSGGSGNAQGPIIETLEADGIHCGYATLNARLNRIPDSFTGDGWEVVFSISTDKDFNPDQTKTTKLTGSSSSGDNYNYTVSPLIAGSKYYYKASLILAEDWIVDGDPVSFTTADAPKNNGYPYIDLGLSVKWAYCNQGANSPTAFGTYFNASTTPSVNYGGNWRKPTMDEMLELVNNCSKTFTRDFDPEEGGIWFTGPSGESIYLQCQNDVGETGDDGFFSSELNWSNFYYGLYLHSNSDNTFTAVKGSYVKYGRLRAVFK